MSWTWRVGLFQRLDNEFKTDIDLSEALNMPQLLQALNDQSPRVVKYIIKHIKEIIDIAIGRTTPIEQNEQKQCINILTKSPVIKENFYKSPDLINYLAESFNDDDLNYSPALNLLQSVIEMSGGSALTFLTDSTSFFQILLKLLPSPSVKSFLLEFFSHSHKPVVKWLIEIDADKFLYPLLFDEEPKICCSLQLLIKLVSILPPESEPMKRIVSKESLQQIFNTGIDAPTIEAAYGSFQLLVTVCNNCDEKEDFEKVIEFLQTKSSQICKYINSRGDFTKDKRALCELLNSIIFASQTVSSEISETVSILFDNFFKYSTNSFLHLSFLKIFQSFAENKEGFMIFISSQKVVDRLLEIEGKREEIMASFWGICTEMELILKETVKDNDEWTKFVNDTLIPRKELIDKNYGGEVPKVKIIFSDTESDQESLLNLLNFSLAKLKERKEKKSSDSDSNSSDDVNDDDDDDELISCSDEEDVDENKESEKKSDSEKDEKVDDDVDENKEKVENDETIKNP